MRVGLAGRARQLVLIDASPLRRVDPRTKLFISLAVSFVVMMPLERLAIFLGIYVLFLFWARLLMPAAEQIWRLKWLLLLLFVFDWWLISFEHAVTICARLILLAGVFALFFSSIRVTDICTPWIVTPTSFTSVFMSLISLNNSDFVIDV